MKFVRSDSSEVARYVASASVRASRRWPALVLGSAQNLFILLIALALGFSVSLRVAAWLSVPVFLVWNLNVLWRAKSSRRNWVVAARAEGVCIRLGVNHPDAIMLEASEIVSVSIRTAEVFLYGPKPKFVEWLLIEPTEAAAESVSNHIHSLLGKVRMLDESIRVHWVDEERRLVIGWKRCHPALRVFLQQVVRERPSVVVHPEERFEVDLNSIWHGIRLNLDAQQRRLLVKAKHLGFDCKCAGLLSVRKHMSFREAQAYLEEIEQEDAPAGHFAA